MLRSSQFHIPSRKAGSKPIWACVLSCVLGAFVLADAASVIDALPGDEVVAEPKGMTAQKPRLATQYVDSITGLNWMAPPVHEQLSRDPVLVTLGKGAVFIPTFSEPRREPELVIFDAKGDVAATGQTGTRILLDSGTYEVRFGSGVSARRLRTTVQVKEGRTATVYPDWGGLLVETLSSTGEYLDGQYDLIRMEDWVNFGRGQGFKEERLQDIDVWLLKPGLYRLSRVGEGYNSLINYITVQINPGELHSVELVFDDAGSLIAGGVKSLNTRARVGQYWTYGLRAGGNASFTRLVDQADIATQSVLFSTDMRLRARYDRAAFFGITELFLQNSFLKQDQEPLRPTQDFLQLRSTWVRRLNNWIGPYIRGQASTHLFPAEVNLDTVYIVSGTDTTTVATGGTFEWQPTFYPLNLAEGAGVNIEWLSRYELELSTQLGLAARQEISNGDYLARTTNIYERAPSIYTVGAEGVLNGKVRLSSRFTLDLRAEVFSEDAKIQNFQLENLEADFRFFLTRNIEVGYLFQMNEISEEVANRFPRSHNVSLRLSFNY
jgi:hypothetical protein